MQWGIHNDTLLWLNTQTFYTAWYGIILTASHCVCTLSSIWLTGLVAQLISHPTLHSSFLCTFFPVPWVPIRQSSPFSFRGHQIPPLCHVPSCLFFNVPLMSTHPHQYETMEVVGHTHKFHRSSLPLWNQMPLSFPIPNQEETFSQMSPTLCLNLNKVTNTLFVWTGLEKRQYLMIRDEKVLGNDGW